MLSSPTRLDVSMVLVMVTPSIYKTGCMSSTVRRIISHITSIPGPWLVIPQEELDMVVDKDIPRIGYQHGQRFS